MWMDLEGLKDFPILMEKHIILGGLGILQCLLISGDVAYWKKYLGNYMNNLISKQRSDNVEI